LEKVSVEAFSDFQDFAHGVFVLETWTIAIKGKKLPAPDLNLWICSKIWNSFSIGATGPSGFKDGQR
jgi:hypothetical protein